MMYSSLNHNAPKVSFEEAVVRGLAPDKGLYFPENITSLSDEFFENITDYSNEEIAYIAIKQFVSDEIDDISLKEIISQTLCFNFPCVSIENNIYTLELFHGPTMAFKDVGARFMARCLGYFNRYKKNQKIKVLVATSGDTGGAVADGFYNVNGVEVIILYPSGKVSSIQEKQLTTLGKNITALEVDGVFDDCQDMVKKAFLDDDLKSRNLTSANSINVARWLPQMFYFLIAYKQLKKQHKNISFIVPSGNFGNICAGIIAYKLGMKVNHFVAATNINDTVPRYMQTQKYNPKPSKQTISNAMDVGNPSNFIRIQHLFDNNFDVLKQIFYSEKFTDIETKEALRSIYNINGYIADPHGAIGYLGTKNYLKENKNTCGVFLETAHPAKFLDVVEKTLNIKVKIPEQLQSVLHKEKKSIRINSYKDLKAYLLK